MKIAVLNESFLKQEHLKKLKLLGDVDVYSSTVSIEQLVDRLKGVDIAVADMFEAPLKSAEALSQIPSVRLIGLNSTGFELVNIKAAQDNKISVANVPGFGTEGVAEHSIALMFATMRHIVAADKAVRNTPFQIDPANKDHYEFKSLNVRGKTLGVIGMGRIGTRVAEIGIALGMNVVGYNRTPKAVAGVQLLDLDKLLATSDVVSINTGLSQETNNLIGQDAIKLMKKNAYLINTAGDRVVDSLALAAALKEKRIAGAGLDFITDWSQENPLLALDNVVLTPHMGWFTDESLDNMADIIVKNIESFVKGNPVNIVS